MSHAPIASSSSEAPPPAHDPLIQYVVLRKDLWATDGWPLGSIVAQACHASSAAMHLFRDDPATQAYLADVDHMHKVVLECKDEAALRALSLTLEEAGVPHKLWVEQPEDYPTALATKPDLKSKIAPHLKALKLCRSKMAP